jgi:hypothetical protein
MQVVFFVFIMRLFLRIRAITLIYSFALQKRKKKNQALQ